jgi:hypothetical protein
VLALVGWIAAFCVHASTWFGIDVPALLPQVWLLHVGMFAVFVPMVLVMQVRGERDIDVALATVPAWVKPAGAILFAYVAANFAYFMYRSGDGSPVEELGRYYLKDHGRIVRELSAAEYAAARIAVLRGFSGHWLVFYFAPAVYFLLRRRAAASGPMS